MADEKRISFDFSVVVDGQTAQVQVSTSEDLTGDLFGTLSQSIPTTAWTALEFGQVTIPDLLFVRNGDVSNYVELAIANDGSGKFAKLTPGRFAFFPPVTGVTFYSKADTAACKVQLAVVEP